MIAAAWGDCGATNLRITLVMVTVVPQKDQVGLAAFPAFPRPNSPAWHPESKAMSTIWSLTWIQSGLWYHRNVTRASFSCSVVELSWKAPARFWKSFAQSSIESPVVVSQIPSAPKQLTNRCHSLGFPTACGWWWAGWGWTLNEQMMPRSPESLSQQHILLIDCLATKHSAYIPRIAHSLPLTCPVHFLTARILK